MTSTTRNPTLGQLVDDRRDHFDALRLISAFAIIVSHYFALRDGDNANEPFMRLSGVHDLNIGKLVTYLCFVISGMAVTRSLMRDPSPIRFLIKRVARIIPALAVCVFLCVLAFGLPLTEVSASAYLRSGETMKFAGNALLYPNHYNLPGVLTQFAQNDVRHAVNGSLWVFPFLFLMYFGIAALAVLRLHCRPLVLLAVAILALVAWEEYELHPLWAWSRYHVWIEFVPHLAFFFFAGAGAAAYRKRIPLNVGLLLLTLAAVAASFYLRRGQYLVLTLCLPYLTIYLSFLRLPPLRPLDKAGVIALGVYLYGYPVQQLFMRVWGARFSPVEQVLYPCIACAVLGTVSWWLIERPVLKRVATKR
jgi:peptidoglycan/LPS O-acetylase OafA/YrhL